MNNKKHATSPQNTAPHINTSVTYFEVFGTANHGPIQADQICILDGGKHIYGGLIKNNDTSVAFYFCLHKNANRVRELLNTSAMIEQEMSSENSPPRNELLRVMVGIHKMISDKNVLAKSMGIFSFIEAKNPKSSI